MRNRSGIQGVASSPVLVGAVTVLVIIVAVFLAYNANNGLPFVSTYDLKAARAERQRAGQRQRGADRRRPGRRGQVGGAGADRQRPGRRRTRPQPRQERRAAAGELDDDHPAEVAARPQVPADRPRQLATKGFAAGETIPVKAARPEPVDIDQFFDMFDEKTRKAIQRNLAGFGNGLAGRGPQLNDAFGALRMLAESAEPAARATWSRPAPASANSGEALEALSAHGRAGGRAAGKHVRRARPHLRRLRPRLAPLHPGNDLARARKRSTRRPQTCRRCDPFLHDSERFFAAFKPGAEGARRNLADDRRRAAAPASRCSTRSPVLNAQLAPTADALLAFQQSPGVFNGLDLLIDTNELLGPAIRFIAPAQTTCNYLTLAFRNLANASDEDNGWATGSARSPSSRRKDRTTRAAQPRLRRTAAKPGQQRGTAQPPPLQPLPEHRRPRSDPRV